MRYGVAIVLALILTGCGLVARDIGYAGAHPGYLKFTCGDGASLQVQGNIAAMIYGGNNSASINCKGTVEILQGLTSAGAPPAPLPPAK